MSGQIKTILLQHGIRATRYRVAIIHFLLSQERSTGSSHTISEYLTQKYGKIDRITLYRNLKTLVLYHILHTIHIEGTCHYILNVWPKQSLLTKNKSTTNTSIHGHPHFQCNSCGDLMCLDQNILASDMLPQGFIINKLQCTLSGICPSCHPPFISK